MRLTNNTAIHMTSFGASVILQGRKRRKRKKRKSRRRRRR